jgi:predicted SAM-dependent methyltransferase
VGNFPLILKGIPVSTVKVNIGSGTNVADGWTNYDRSIWLSLSKYNFFRKLLYTFRLVDRKAYQTVYAPNVVSSIIRRDVRRGIPHKSGSVDFIYCSHFLEHIKHEEALKVLMECHRVLKTGGWVRVVCPDLRFLVNKYVEGNLNYFGVQYPEELSQAFIKSLMVVDDRSTIKKLLFGVLGYDIHRHQYMYDYDSLKTLLHSAGFDHVEKVGFKRGVTPDIDKLDDRVTGIPEYRQLESIYLEAQKR